MQRSHALKEQENLFNGKSNMWYKKTNAYLFL